MGVNVCCCRTSQAFPSIAAASWGPSPTSVDVSKALNHYQLQNDNLLKCTSKCWKLLSSRSSPHKMLTILPSPYLIKLYLSSRLAPRSMWLVCSPITLLSVRKAISWSMGCETGWSEFAFLIRRGVFKYLFVFVDDLWLYQYNQTVVPPVHPEGRFRYHPSPWISSSSWKITNIAAIKKSQL